MLEIGNMTSPSNLKTVSLLGCGWLGLPLAERLVQTGFSVQGSTTRTTRMATIQSVGAEALLLRIDPEPDRGPKTESGAQTWAPSEAANRFFHAHTLLLDIPPQAASGPEHYPSQVRNILYRREAGGFAHLIFVSSTSVYGSLQGEVNEETTPKPDSASGEILLGVENSLRKEAKRLGFHLSIVRPAGLVGPGRHPGLFLANRKGLKDPLSPINLVHQLDVAMSLLSIITSRITVPLKERETDVYNLVSRLHPTRQEFYTRASQALDLVVPQFSAASSQDSTKIVYGEKIREKVQFVFDDLMSAIGSRQL